MSALWDSAAAAQATGGTAIGQWRASGISIDTRTLNPGDLFVPLKDARDGHEFIAMAYEKGAAAVISERAILDAPALIVEDTLKALEDLGKAALVRSKAKRIAITGSVGKTTVKTMLARALRPAGKVHASEKSFNNHWGVPLTMAKLPKDADFAIFEMGMNHAGELSHLTDLVRPDIAVITTVCEAHLEFFNSLDHIAKAKAEIFEGLPASGFGVFNAASPYKSLFLAAIKGMPKTFGKAPADCAVIRSTATPDGSQITVAIGGETQSINIPFAGDHWVENTACVLLVTNLVGADLSKAAAALESMSGIAGRGQMHSLWVEGKSITLIDESYNANPQSMRSAIAALGLRPARRVAVLGDMLELGDKEHALHASLKTSLDEAGVDLVITCGPRMRALNDALDPAIRGGWFETFTQVEPALRARLKDGDSVMIKGSNASGMGNLVGALINQYTKKDMPHAV